MGVDQSVPEDAAGWRVLRVVLTSVLITAAYWVVVIFLWHFERDYFIWRDAVSGSWRIAKTDWWVGGGPIGLGLVIAGSIAFQLVLRREPSLSRRVAPAYVFVPLLGLCGSSWGETYRDAIALGVIGPGTQRTFTSIDKIDKIGLASVAESSFETRMESTTWMFPAVEPFPPVK